MYGRNQWGSYFILARPPPGASPENRNRGRQPFLACRPRLLKEGGPWFGTIAGLYPAEGTGLRRMGSIPPSSVISFYQIGGLPC